MNTYSYHKKGSLVIIKEWMRRDVAYTKESCEQALENIKARRNDYLTQKAFDAQIAKISGALVLFDD